MNSQPSKRKNRIGDGLFNFAHDKVSLMFTNLLLNLPTLV